VNHKRVYRLYSAANLAVRKRKKAKRPASERVPLQIASEGQRGVEHGFCQATAWSMVAHQVPDGGDDVSHECVDIATDFGIGGQ